MSFKADEALPEMCVTSEYDKMDVRNEEEDEIRAMESDVYWKRQNPLSSCARMNKRKYVEDGEIKKSETPDTDVTSTSFIQIENSKKAKPLQTTSLTVNMFIPNLNLSKKSSPIKTSIELADKGSSSSSSTSKSALQPTSIKQQDEKDLYNYTSVSQSDEINPGIAVISSITIKPTDVEGNHSNRTNTSKDCTSETHSPLGNIMTMDNGSDFQENIEDRYTFQEEAPSIHMSPSDMHIASPPSTSVPGDSIVNCKSDKQVNNSSQWGFQCDICGVTCDSPSMLNNHTNCVKEVIKTCKVCGMSFWSTEDLVAHNRLYHYLCPCEPKLCDEPVRISNDMQSFQISEHYEGNGTGKAAEPNNSIQSASNTQPECDSLLSQTGDSFPANELIPGKSDKFNLLVYMEGSVVMQTTNSPVSNMNSSTDSTTMPDRANPLRNEHEVQNHMNFTTKADSNVVQEVIVDKLFVNDNQESGDQSPIKTPTENQSTDNVDKEEERVIYLEVPDFSELDSRNRQGGGKRKKEVDDDEWCPQSSQEKTKTKKRIMGESNKSITKPRPRKKKPAGIVAKKLSQEQVSLQETTKCNVCKKCFLTPEILECHRLVVHSGRNACGICSQWFPNKTAKTKHIAERHDGRGYKCKVCEKSFRTASDVSHHMVTHKVGRTYQCPVCRHTCNFKLTAISHFEETHFPPSPQPNNENNTTRTDSISFEPQEGTGFTCKVCQMCFPTSNILAYHVMLRHYYDHTYCKLCNIKFKTMNERKAHHETTHKNCTHICEICGKECKDISKLKKHMKVHNPERPYACPACPKKYNIKSELRRHIILKHLPYVNHNGERSDKEFSNEVKKSRKTAGGGKCEEERNPIKKVIKKQVHGKKDDNEGNVGISNKIEGDLSTQTDSKKAFACYVCGNSYSKEKNLQDHFEAKHYEEKDIKCRCKLCGRVFCTEVRMVRHQCNNDNKPKYMCDVCGKSFRRVAFFKKHKEQGHK